MFAVLLVATTLGCRAYREKKAEFMRNDARSIEDKSARIRAMVDADCFVEVGKAPADSPESQACRKEMGPKRIAEAGRGARGVEARFYEAWASCVASSDGSSTKWSQCEQAGHEAAEPAPPPPPPPPPVKTSTTSTTT